MKPKIPLLFVVLFMSLSITSSAQWISVGAVWNGFDNTSGNLNDFWAGTVYVQTPVDWYIDSSPGSASEISLHTTPNFFERAIGGQVKQGSTVLYPGDLVGLYAEILTTAEPGHYHQAVSSIFPHVPNAIR